MQVYTAEERAELIEHARHMLTLTAPGGLSTQLFQIALAALEKKSEIDTGIPNSRLIRLIQWADEAKSVHVASALRELQEYRQSSLSPASAINLAELVPD